MNFLSQKLTYKDMAMIFDLKRSSIYSMTKRVNNPLPSSVKKGAKGSFFFTFEIRKWIKDNRQELLEKFENYLIKNDKEICDEINL